VCHETSPFFSFFILLCVAFSGGCSAGFSYHQDLRAAVDELHSSLIITFDYNLSPSQGYFEERMIVPAGDTFTFPVTSLEPQYRRVQDGITMVLTGWNDDPNGTGLAYDINAVSSPVTEHHTYYAQWTVIGGIGPGGGVVVFNDPDRPYGFQYLEMAGTINGGAPMAWHQTISIYPITGESFALGMTNTDAITALATYPTAAAACADFEQNGYTDWFLPSFYELNWHRQFLDPGRLYWTSSLLGTEVYVVSNSSYSTEIQTESSSVYVRPFRSF